MGSGWSSRSRRWGSLAGFARLSPFRRNEALLGVPGDPLDIKRGRFDKGHELGTELASAASFPPLPESGDAQSAYRSLQLSIPNAFINRTLQEHLSDEDQDRLIRDYLARLSGSAA